MKLESVSNLSILENDEGNSKLVSLQTILPSGQPYVFKVKVFYDKILNKNFDILIPELDNDDNRNLIWNFISDKI